MNLEDEVSADMPKWSGLDVGLVLLLLFALIPGAGLFRALIIKMLDALQVKTAGPGLFLFLGTLVQAIVMTASVFFLTKRKGATKEDLGLVSDNPVSHAATGLLWGVLLGIGVIFLGAVVSFVFGPPPPQDVEKLLQGLKEGKELWLPLLAVSVLAPVSEEIFFRGMAYPVIKARFGTRTAMILSALFFGGMHLDMYRLIPIAAGGIGLAYLYEKTGSLLTPIVAHSTWNTMMLAILYIAGSVS